MSRRGETTLRGARGGASWARAEKKGCGAARRPRASRRSLGGCAPAAENRGGLGGGDPATYRPGGARLHPEIPGHPLSRRPRWARPLRGCRRPPALRGARRGEPSEQLARASGGRGGAARGPLPSPDPSRRSPSGAPRAACSPLAARLGARRGPLRGGQGQEPEGRCPRADGRSRAEATAAAICPCRPGSGTGAGGAERAAEPEPEPEPEPDLRSCGRLSAPIPPPAQHPCARQQSEAGQGRGAREDGIGGPGPHGLPAALGPRTREDSAGGRRGRPRLATMLRLPLPGALGAGVPVQALRPDRLLLLGPLCQLHLPLRPGLGGGPVPALPGQVQVSAFAGSRTPAFPCATPLHPPGPERSAARAAPQIQHLFPCRHPQTQCPAPSAAKDAELSGGC